MSYNKSNNIMVINMYHQHHY